MQVGRVLGEDFFLGAFICLKRKLIASKTASIHFSNPRQKVKSGFGLRGDGFLHALLLGVFPTAILLGLGTNRGLKVVVEYIN